MVTSKTYGVLTSTATKLEHYRIRVAEKALTPHTSQLKIVACKYTLQRKFKNIFHCSKFGKLL